jgi:hypothetical protein
MYNNEARRQLLIEEVITENKNDSNKELEK